MYEGILCGSDSNEAISIVNVLSGLRMLFLNSNDYNFFVSVGRLLFAKNP
jgi:hypothetical protein